MPELTKAELKKQKQAKSSLKSAWSLLKKGPIFWIYSPPADGRDAVFVAGKNLAKARADAKFLGIDKYKAGKNRFGTAELNDKKQVEFAPNKEIAKVQVFKADVVEKDLKWIKNKKAIVIKEPTVALDPDGVATDAPKNPTQTKELFEKASDLAAKGEEARRQLEEMQAQLASMREALEAREQDAKSHEEESRKGGFLSKAKGWFKKKLGFSAFRTVEADEQIKWLKSYLGVKSLKALEKEWHGYIRGMKAASADGYHWAGTFAMSRNMPIKAQRLFKVAIDMGSKNPMTWIGLGRAQHRKNKDSEALASFDKAIEMDSLTAMFYIYKARVLEEAGAAGKEEARKLRKLALEIEPENDQIIMETVWDDGE